MALKPGASVGPYEIIERIGVGGMASVYRARQRSLDRIVAVKVLPDSLAASADFRERFHREAVAIAALRHPAILKVIDHGQSEATAYIVTELLDSGTLAGRITAPIPTSAAIDLLRPVAEALDYAHAAGVVHRDFKPSNIMFGRSGKAVLTDFGLVRMVHGGHLTEAGAVLGTPEYMSPEQCAGEEAGPASDLYALGVIAYQMLTGRTPFTDDTPMKLVIAHLQKEPPDAREINPAISIEVDKVLMRSLAKQPEDRCPSCTEFIRELERADRLAATRTLRVAAFQVCSDGDARREGGRVFHSDRSDPSVLGAGARSR